MKNRISKYSKEFELIEEERRQSCPGNLVWKTPGTLV
jgi:hypothetical protein